MVLLGLVVWFYCLSWFVGTIANHLAGKRTLMSKEDYFHQGNVKIQEDMFQQFFEKYFDVIVLIVLIISCNTVIMCSPTPNASTIKTICSDPVARWLTGRASD